ncbi:MAG: GtrA family protein [Pseudomonadota bacterium]
MNLRAQITALTPKFFGYLASGGTAAVVDLGAYIVLVHLDLAPFPAAVLSFCFACVVNFLLSARYVFRTDAGLARFRQFFVFAVIGLVINATVTTAVASVLPEPIWLPKLVGIAVAFVFNFLINALHVFRV